MAIWDFLAWFQYSGFCLDHCRPYPIPPMPDSVTLCWVLICSSIFSKILTRSTNAASRLKGRVKRRLVCFDKSTQWDQHVQRQFSLKSRFVFTKSTECKDWECFIALASIIALPQCITQRGHYHGLAAGSWPIFVTLRAQTRTRYHLYRWIWSCPKGSEFFFMSVRGSTCHMVSMYTVACIPW